MRNSVNIMIPTERHHQLKAIGAALDLSISETIARMVRIEIDKNTIPADLPGVSIDRVAGGVRIVIDDNAPTTLPKAAAADLADTIARAANGEPRHVMDLDADFAVERRGNGVKVSVPLTGEARAFSRDVAQDLARLIKTAAE